MSSDKKRPTTDDPGMDPANAKSIEVFMNVQRSDYSPQTARAAMGFFVIWSFERNLADFSSPKINKELVQKLHQKIITIEDFVQDSLKDEITSKIFLPQADSFAKYYFRWKYLSDCEALLGKEFSGSWENYARIKARIQERFAFWVVDPQKALDEKLKEQDPNARAGQLSTRSQSIFSIPPHPNTTFDEDNFLMLLEGSISLTMEEKQRVIEAIPRLSIEQINELISIFTEEKQKFSELENEFADDVKKLKEEREREIERVETKKEETQATSDDEEEAAKIKQQMGL
jgi:gas vesicle protein